MKNISCRCILLFFCTSLLGDAEMIHKLHVLQYPGLGNVSPRITHSRRCFSFAHTLARTHTFFLSGWKVEYGLQVLLIGCKAAVASPVYTSLERGQH